MVVHPALARAVRAAVVPVAERGVGGVVAGAPLESDAPAPRSAALVNRVVSLVAGALGPATRGARSPMSLEEARAEAATSSSLAYVQTRVSGGELRVTIDLYPIPRNIWDRSRTEAPGPVAHGFGGARIDAEVRSYLAPTPLIALNPRKVPLPAPEVLALACHDVDDDGALELVVLSRRTVTKGRIRQGKFLPLREANWNDLSSIAPSPWREPLGTVGVAAGRVDLGLTDRALSVRLDGELGLVATYGGMPVPSAGGVACSPRRVGSLAAELGPCLPGDPSPPSQAPFPFDAAAWDLTFDTHGRPRNVWAVRSPTDGSVALRDDRGGQHVLQNVGAQIALADIDLDGDPDLVASKNVLNARNDALVVRSWRAAGTLDKRLEVAAPDGITALAVCPPDGPGLRTMVVATSRELWVLP